jgi:hypothetical protein
MAIVNTNWASVIAAVRPEDRAAAQAISVFRGQRMTGFNISIARDSNPEETWRYVGVSTRFDLNSLEGDFWKGVNAQNLSLDDLPEGTTQEQLDAFYASLALFYHIIQEDDGNPGVLLNEAGDGPWNARQHWLDTLAGLGFVPTQEPEPAPERYVILRENITPQQGIAIGDAAIAASGVTMTNAERNAFMTSVLDQIFPRWNE